MAPALQLQDFEAVIDLLQQLAIACSSSAGASTPANATTLQSLWDSVQPLIEHKQEGTIPTATLRQLITNKVPLRLASACADILKQCCRPTEPSAQQQAAKQPLTASAFSLVVRLLQLFLTRWQQTAMHRSNSDSSSSIQASFRQQMQESGLLQQLPAAVEAAAAQLQVAAAVPPTFDESVAVLAASQLTTFGGLAVGPPSIRMTGSNGSGSTSSGSGGSGTGQTGRNSGSSATNNAGALSTTVDVALDATATLTVLAALDSYWPEGQFPVNVAPACSASALKTVSLAFPFVSHCMAHPSVQNSSSMHALLSGVWVIAEELARLAIFPVAYGTPAADQYAARLAAAAGPELMSCIASLMTMSAYKQLVLQLPTLPAGYGDGSSGGSAGSGGSSGSRCDSSSSSGRDPAGNKSMIASLNRNPTSSQHLSQQAWQLAGRECSRVPGTHIQLARQLGCDMRVLLWAAISDCATKLARAQQKAVAARSHTTLKFMVAAYMEVSGLAERQISRLQKEQQEQLVWLHYCLPSLLLYWVAHHVPQQDSPKDDSGLKCGAVMCASMAEGRCRRGYKLTLHHAIREQMLSAFNLGRGASGVSIHLEPPPLVPEEVHETMLQEAFLLASHVATALLPQLGRRPGFSMAASGSSGSSSAASTSRSRSSSSASAVDANLKDKALRLVFLLTNIASHELYQGVACFDIGSTPQPVEVQLAQQHSMWMMQLLEAAVRDEVLVCPGLGEGCICLLGPHGPYDGVLVRVAQQADSSSPERKQLMSLCCSILKAAVVWGPDRADCPDDLSMQPEMCCRLVMNAAAALIADTDVVLSGGPGEVTTAGWLWVFGRCLLQLAAFWRQGAGRHITSKATTLMLAQLPLCLAQLVSWLRGDGVMQHLSAAGYDAAGLLLRAEACPAVVLDAVADLTATTPQFQALGTALTTMAFAQGCNNPSCCNLEGPTERQLVAGRSCVCSGDHVARYCSRACQRAHWKQHKPVCKALAAAAAATAAAPQ